MQQFLVHSLKGGALSKFQKSHKTIFKRLATKAAGRGVRSATIRRGLRDDLRMSMLVFEQTLLCIGGILAHSEHPLWTVEQTFLDRSTIKEGIHRRRRDSNKHLRTHVRRRTNPTNGCSGISRTFVCVFVKANIALRFHLFLRSNVRMSFKVYQPTIVTIEHSFKTIGVCSMA